MAERVRLVGIARGRAQVLVQRTVVADDQGAFGRIDVLDPFDLELDDGRVVRVHPATEARIEPLSKKDVKWGDIEDDPSFASLKERGPGPHVTVTVKRSAIRAGDRVALDGEEKDFSFEDEDKSTTRTAPTKKLSAVTADVLASGDDAEKIVAHVVDGPPKAAQEKKAKKKSAKQRARDLERQKKLLLAQVTAPRVLSLLGFATLAVAFTMRVSPAFVDTVTLGLVLYGIALMVAATRGLPRFVRESKAVEELGGGAFGAAVLAVMVLGAMFMLTVLADVSWAWKLPPAGVRETNGSWVFGPVGVVFLAFMLGLFVRCSRKRASLLSALVDAPSFTGPPNDTTWGSVEGIVRDPTPVTVEGTAHAIASVVKREVRGGSDPDIVTETVLNKGTFFVDAEIGTFEIDPTQATWASAVRTVTSDTDDKKVFADVVVIEGRVVVAGRAVAPAKGEPARFVAGRAESLVFYATGRDVDARAKARSLLFRRRLAIVGFLVAMATIAGVMALYEPELPALYIDPPSGGD